MTRDEIIAMAQEAGVLAAQLLHQFGTEGALCDSEIRDLRAAERLAQAAYAAGAAAEREECAKVAAEPQGWAMPSFNHAPSDRTIGRIEGEKEMSYRIAAAIRARGNK